MFATRAPNPPKSVARASLIIHGMVKKRFFVNVFIIVIKLGKKIERKTLFVGYKFFLYEPP